MTAALPIFRPLSLQLALAQHIRQQDRHRLRLVKKAADRKKAAG